jgi:hypothetical protein
MNANVQRKMQGVRQDGKKYEIAYSTGPHGFRVWGDIATQRHRVLVVGDSFTEAYQVSNDKTYYAVLKRMLGEDWELFAYGEGGYGTLQEYLVLHEYVGLIKPDVVLWQFCGNDLCNNSYYIDSHTFENFSMLPRPYLEEDEIRVRCPHYLPLLSYHSALWRYLGPRVAMVFLHGKKSRVDRLSINSAVMRSAIDVTDEILKRAEVLLEGVPVYAFNVSSGEVPEALSQLATRHGFHMIDNIDGCLRDAEQKGIVVWAHASIGGHWSEEGHAIVGEALFQSLRQEEDFAFIGRETLR